MKFGKIYTYENASEAEKLIGKSVYYSDNLREVSKECEFRSLDIVKDNIGTLQAVNTTGLFPFRVNSFRFQFIREVIEEEKEEPKLMTNRQLSEWLARGFGEKKCSDKNPVSAGWVYFDEYKDLPVEESVLIRSWDLDEWEKPTVDIYERDCKSYCKTTLS